VILGHTSPKYGTSVDRTALPSPAYWNDDVFTFLKIQLRRVLNGFAGPLRRAPRSMRRIARTCTARLHWKLYGHERRDRHDRHRAGHRHNLDLRRGVGAAGRPAAAVGHPAQQRMAAGRRGESGTGP